MKMKKYRLECSKIFKNTVALNCLERELLEVKWQIWLLYTPFSLIRNHFIGQGSGDIIPKQHYQTECTFCTTPALHAQTMHHV